MVPSPVIAELVSVATGRHGIRAETTPVDPLKVPGARLPKEAEVWDRQELKPESDLHLLVPWPVPVVPKSPGLLPAPEPGSHELVDGEVVLLALSWETIQGAVELGPGSLPVQELWEAHPETLATADEGLLDPASEQSAPRPVVLLLWHVEGQLSIQRPRDVSRAAPGTSNLDRQIWHHGEPVEAVPGVVLWRLEGLVVVVQAPADDRPSIERLEVALVCLKGLAVVDALLLGLAHAEELVPDVVLEMIGLTNWLQVIVTKVIP